MGKLLKTNEMLSPGLDIIRIISGGIIFTYGLEIFDSEQIGGYTQWLTDVGIPWPGMMAYIGKLTELIGGIFLVIGLLTRLSAIPLIMVMCVINFIMLDGNPRSEPFYLLLIFASFLFNGSGKISVDYWLERRKQSRN
ncbi:MAG: DoxX family protein [Cytophagales bacterium]|nr:DoxX family protein [Cytophagales bacterium]